MRKIWVVAVREYVATVKTKAFILGLVMMPILMGGGIGVQLIVKRFEDRGEKTIAVIDRTPGQKLLPMLEQAVQKRNEHTIIDKKTKEQTAPAFKLAAIAPSENSTEAMERQRLDLSDRVKKGEFAGFLEIGPDVLKTPSLLSTVTSFFDATDQQEDDKVIAAKSNAIRFQSRPTAPGAREFYRWVQLEATRAVLISRFQNSGLPTSQLYTLFQPVAIRSMGLSSKDPKTGAVDESEGVKLAAPIFVTIGAVMLMFTMIFAGATPLMQGVLEEKMQRIAEVLLGSARPFELMMGKLLGSIGVSLTLSVVYLGGSLLGLSYYELTNEVPTSLIGWFVFYQVLALFMYGSMFIAVGAACTDMKEPQTLMLPVTMMAMIPLFLLGPIMSDPDGLLARTVSFFPPSTPILMVGRQAMNAGIAWWEPIVGAILVILTTIVCVWAAGRIFRVGMLVQGKGAKFSEMLKWVVRE